MKELLGDLDCSQSSCDNLTELYTYNNPLYVYNRIPNIILIATYIPLFLVSLISNILVIVVVSRYRCLRSVTNYFLVNLSIADLLVTLICMPMAVGQAIYSLWLYGDFMCKLTHYLQGVSTSASVFTITAMSIDRYMAIRHPMSRKIINRRTTTKVIFILWCLALVIFAPILFIRKSEGFKFAWDSKEFLYCVESWPDKYSQKTFGMFCFITVYLVPGVIVVLAYSLMGLRLCSRQLLPEYEVTHGPPGNDSRHGDLGHSSSTNSAWQVSAVGGRLIRERRRVAKILLVLAVVFALCWLPYSVLSLIWDMTAKTVPAPGDELENFEGGTDFDEQLTYIVNLLLPFAILLGHSQAAVNPLLYCLLSKNFRRSVTDLIRHPTRVIRSRQQCKIRMTFRKDPVPSAEPNSSEKPVSCRPRNHHAPDPPRPASASPCNTGVIMEPEDIRLMEICKKSGSHGESNHNEVVLPYSPSQSSSGYGSCRGSENAQSCSQCSQYQSLSMGSNMFITQNNSLVTAGCPCYSMTLCPYPHIPSSMCQQCPGPGTPVIYGKRGCSAVIDYKKVEVPSTICEESENSHLSQRSNNKSNNSIKAF